MFFFINLAEFFLALLKKPPKNLYTYKKLLIKKGRENLRSEFFVFFKKGDHQTCYYGFWVLFFWLVLFL